MTDKNNSTNKTDEKQIVIFRLGNEEFGVNINEVREIIRMEQITHVPNTQEYIKGVINLRGGIIVVIDLAMKLGLPIRQADTNTRIIVIEVDNNTIGMIVDSATEVLRLQSEEIKGAPAIITEKINSDFIDGVGIIGERLLILLDLAKVMHAKDVEIIKKMQQSALKPTEVKPENILKPSEINKPEPIVQQSTDNPEVLPTKEESKGAPAQTAVAQPQEPILQTQNPDTQIQK